MKVKELQALLSRSDGEAYVYVRRPLSDKRLHSYPIDECWIEEGKCLIWIDSTSLAGESLKQSLKERRRA